jgi:beta-glucosidase
MPWVDQATTILQAFFLGCEMGNAIADVITGIVNPSGKLPVSFPRRIEDSPSHRDHPHIPTNINYSESIFVGYRHYLREGAANPLFPFGHGLSYTEFTIPEAVINGSLAHNSEVVTLDCTVQNCGSLAGSETVIVWALPPRDSLTERASAEVAGFAKTRVIRPAETQRLTISIPRLAISYWNECESQWVVEAGTWRMKVGGSAIGGVLVITTIVEF